MELQSLRTSCNCLFYYDKDSIHYEMPCVDGNKGSHEPCNQVFSLNIPTHLKNRTIAGSVIFLFEHILGLEPNTVYSFDSLLNYNFIKDMIDNPEKYGTGIISAISVIREWLLSIGLMNKYDKDYLTSINFDDDDFNIEIDSIQVDEFIKTPLKRAGLDKLYKLLLIDYKSLTNINRFNEQYIARILPFISELGYSLNNIKETPHQELSKVESKKEVDPIKKGESFMMRTEAKRIISSVQKRKRRKKNDKVKYKKLITSTDADFFMINHDIFFHSPYSESDIITNPSELYNTQVSDCLLTWALEGVIGLRDKKIHRVNEVLQFDFEEKLRNLKCNPYQYKEYLRNLIKDITYIRERLVKFGLFNELDMKYLKSIGLKNGDFEKRLDEIGIDANVRQALTYCEINKLYQLLLTDINHLGTFKMIGWERLGGIIIALENYGYPARTNASYEGLTKDQIGLIEDYRLHKVIDSKYIYEKKVAKLQEDVKKLNKNIN